MQNENENDIERLFRKIRKDFKKELIRFEKKTKKSKSKFYV